MTFREITFERKAVEEQRSSTTACKDGVLYTIGLFKRSDEEPWWEITAYDDESSPDDPDPAPEHDFDRPLLGQYYGESNIEEEVVEFLETIHPYVVKIKNKRRPQLALVIAPPVPSPLTLIPGGEDIPE